MAAIEVSNFVLLFNNITGRSDVSRLSENARYLVRSHDFSDTGFWKGNQSHILFGLSFGKHMYTPQGWTFGSSDDVDVCDFQLAQNNQSGVSRQHVRIDIEPRTSKPRIRVISRNPIKVSILATEGKRKRTVLLDQGESLEIDDAVEIDLGQISFRAWQPALAASDYRQYKVNAERFNKEFLDSILRFPISIGDEGQPTATMRFGADNTCYKRHNTSYGRTGSFATVYKIQELRSQKLYAAKVPHFRSRDSASVSRRRWEGVLDEFKLLKLQHPNIVKVFEVLPGRLVSDPPWLVMEWIEHDLASCQLQKEDVPKLLLQILEGVNFLHAKEVVHRDLKPSNILLHLDRDRLRVAKIADFGNSKRDHGGQMQSYTGTNVYMAPEILQGCSPYTKAVDLWAVGIVAAQYLTEWDPSLDAWDANCPPNEEQHQSWIRRVKDDHLPNAPNVFQPLLRGLLSTSVSLRWTGPQAVEFVRTRSDSNSIEAIIVAQDPLILSGDNQNAQRTADANDLDFEGLSPIASMPTSIDSAKIGARLAVNYPTFTNTSTFHESSTRHEYLSDTLGNKSLSPSLTGAHTEEDKTDLEHSVDVTGLLDLGDSVSLDVNGKIVHLIKTTGIMAASEILAMSSLPADRKRRLSEHIKRTTVVLPTSDNIPITYGHAKMLSKYLEVAHQLQPLFTFGDTTLPHPHALPTDSLASYLEVFTVISTRQSQVSIRSKDLWINLSHALKAVGYKDRMLTKTMTKIRTDLKVRVELIVNVPRQHQGNYVCFDDGLMICARYKLDDLIANLTALRARMLETDR